jgi:hypothetical protein
MNKGGLPRWLEQAENLPSVTASEADRAMVTMKRNRQCRCALCRFDCLVYNGPRLA